MRIVPLAFLLALGAAPAFAQDYGHGGWGGQRNAHAEEHRGRDAAEAADRYNRHARRDAAVGDYHGAEHARRRAQAAAEDARRHGEAARHGYGGHGHGYGVMRGDRH